MGSAWHEVSSGRWAARWVGLLGVLLLIGACGGERGDAPAAGTGMATADSAAAAAADTAASGASATAGDTVPASDTAGTTAEAAGDTAPVPGRDTAAASQRTSQPAPATQPSKPAPTTEPTKPAQAMGTSKPAPEATEQSEPAQAPAPAPKPAPTQQPAATPEPADSPEAAATAQARDTAATRDTATAQDTAQEETQTAVAPLRDEYHQAPKDTVSQEVYDGWKQYNLNCARCHGEDVLGSTIAPHLIMSLKPDGPINTQEAFTQVVCAGRPEKGMPSWCALGMEPAKINQIYAYVKGRSAGEIGPGRPALREGS